MKRLPQGIWKDTGFSDTKFRVLYYDSRSKCYRIQYLNMMGMRMWTPIEEFGERGRFQPMGAWGFLLQQRLDRKARRRPMYCAADAAL